MERSGALHLNKLESFYPRMPCAKFGWNWLRVWSFIWTNLNLIHLGILCAKFGWNWPSGYGGEDENVNSLQTDRRTDRQTDDRRQVIRKAHLSFQLRWAKNNRHNEETILYRSILIEESSNCYRIIAPLCYWLFDTKMGVGLPCSPQFSRCSYHK